MSALLLKHRIGNRIKYSTEVIRGPYVLKERWCLKISSGSFLDRKVLSSLITSEDLASNHKIELGVKDSLSLSVHRENQGLVLRIPKSSVLKKATFFGWETYWNGIEMDSSSDWIELKLPQAGWWRVSSRSYWIDLKNEFVIPKSSSVFSLNGIQSGIDTFKSRGFRSFLLAGLAHSFLFFALLHTDELRKKVNGILNPKQEFSEEQASGAPVVPVQFQAEVEEVAFLGRSLFADLAKTIEKPADAESLVEKMKNLGSLFKKAPVARIDRAQIQKGAEAPQNLSNSSLNGLQAGLLKGIGGSGKGNSAKGGVGVSSGLRQVNWKSQFQTQDKSGGGLSESQQQALYESFAKLQESFRGCYETALLKFEEMTVTVSFEGEINNLGGITKPGFSVSGRSTPESQEVLLGCLKNVMKQLKVNSKLSGVKIKNQFLFKS